MRTDTIRQIDSAVCEVENSIRYYEKPGYKCDALPLMIDRVYKVFTRNQLNTSDYSTAVRTDGKEAIREAIKQRILVSEIIKFRFNEYFVEGTDANGQLNGRATTIYMEPERFKALTSQGVRIYTSEAELLNSVHSKKMNTAEAVRIVKSLANVGVVVTDEDVEALNILIAAVEKRSNRK